MKFTSHFSTIFLLSYMATTPAFAADVEQELAQERSSIIAHQDLTQMRFNGCLNASCSNEALAIFNWLATQSPRADRVMADDVSATDLLAYVRPQSVTSGPANNQFYPSELRRYLRQITLAPWHNTTARFRTGILLLAPNSNATPYFATFYVYQIRTIKRAFVIDPKRQQILDEYAFDNAYATQIERVSIWQNFVEAFGRDNDENNPVVVTQEVALPDYLRSLFSLIEPNFKRATFLDDYARDPITGKDAAILRDLKTLPLLKAKINLGAQERLDYENALNKLCWRALFDMRNLYLNDEEERAFTYLTMLKFFFAYDVVPEKWRDKVYEIKRIFRSLDRMTSTSDALSAKVAKWLAIYEGQFAMYLASHAHDAKSRAQHLEDAYHHFIRAIAVHTTKTSHLFVARLILVHGFRPHGITDDDAKKEAQRHVDEALSTNSVKTKKPRAKTHDAVTKSLMHKIAQPTYLNAKVKINVFAASTSPSREKALQSESIETPEVSSHDDDNTQQSGNGFFIPFTDEDFEGFDDIAMAQDNRPNDADLDKIKKPTRKRTSELTKHEKQRVIFKTYKQLAREIGKNPSAMAVANNVAHLDISYGFVLTTLKTKGLVKEYAKHVPTELAEEIRVAYFDPPRHQPQPSVDALAERFEVKPSQVTYITKNRVMPDKQRKQLEKTKKVIAAHKLLEEDEIVDAPSIIAERTGINNSTVRSILQKAGLIEAHKFKKRVKKDDNTSSDEERESKKIKQTL